jgi:hypothetical protein
MVKEALFPSWHINDIIHNNVAETLTGIIRLARYCGFTQSVPFLLRQQLGYVWFIRHVGLCSCLSRRETVNQLLDRCIYVITLDPNTMNPSPL